MRKQPEPVQIVKERRDKTLAALVEGIPYLQFLGIEFERHGDELTAILRYDDKLIGNPILPALHGGVTAAFLETTAIIELGWQRLWREMESGRITAEGLDPEDFPRIPKSIYFPVEYLRSGLPRDAYARARVTRSGRRYASVHVEAWQDNRSRLYAQATGHFMMPPEADPSDG